MLESKYQAELIKKLKVMFPGCIVLKNNSAYMQGIPDLTIFHGKRWAMLEVKPEKPVPGSNDFEPNQEWYIEQLNRMTFCACIYPENEKEVLDGVSSALQPGRKARVPKS